MGTHLTQVRRDRLKNLKPGTTLVVHVRKPNEDAVQDIYVGGLVRQLIAPGKGTPDRPGVVIDRPRRRDLGAVRSDPFRLPLELDSGNVAQAYSTL